MKEGNTTQDGLVLPPLAVVFGYFVTERRDEQVESQTGGMRAAISVKGVDLERILEVTVFDPCSVLFNILLVSGVVAHDAAGQLYGKLETGLEAIIFRRLRPKGLTNRVLDALYS